MTIWHFDLVRGKRGRRNEETIEGSEVDSSTVGREKKVEKKTSLSHLTDDTKNDTTVAANEIAT